MEKNKIENTQGKDTKLTQKLTIHWATICGLLIHIHNAMQYNK